MKNEKSGKGSSATKAKSTPKNFQQYLARVPDAARSNLIKIREVIRSVVPAEASEIVSYGMPAFKRNGILVWFAAFADHTSLFPKASIIEAFQKELKGFTTSKETIQFPLDKPLPIALIKKIVKARVAENESQKQRKK